MNSQNTQLLTDEIQNKLSKDLKNSKKDVAFEDESTSKETTGESQSSINSESIELNDAVDKQEFHNFADVVHSKELKETCWLDDYGYRVCKP
ncbi:MAG: hypothetical protein KME50_22860 [Nostoc desertorum CM1-VF14]|jgi:hypothetical protein|nr:hypothetical protein [Nostoc desertorum CM1-VF14]